MKALLIFLFPISLLAHSLDGEKKVRALMVLKDYNQANIECSKLITNDPQNPDLYALKLQCLGEIKPPDEVVQFFRELPFEPDQKMLQTFGWSVLKTATGSSNLVFRKVGLIGTFLTQDVKSVVSIEKALNDANRSIRMLAARLSVQMPDLRLQNALVSRLKNEKDFFVRLELIEALGALRGIDGQKPLKNVLTSFFHTTEEKQAAISSLLQHDLDEAFFRELIQSGETYRLLFVIDAILHYKKTSMKKKLYESLSHFNKDVRASSLMALYFLEDTLHIDMVSKMLNDTHPLVQMIAAYVLMPYQPQDAIAMLKKWLTCRNKLYKLFASCLVANGGKALLPTLIEAFEKEEDPFCKMNLALGLLRNRAYIEQAAGFVISCIKDPNFKCVRSPIFRSFFPSILPINKGHRFGAFGYEQIDSMTKLELIEGLLQLDIAESEDLLKNFLKHAHFGIGIEALQKLFSIQPVLALNKMEEFLKDDELTVRLQAAILCCFFGKTSVAKEVLMKDYFKVDRETKLNILDALIHLREEKLAPFFLNVMLEENEVLQIAASAGLICAYR